MGNYKLELISIHIPKTGGTSFRNTLQDVYGKDTVQLYYEKKKAEGRIILKKKAKVLHGHITTKEYDQLVEDYPFLDSIPLITWIRDPAERVVSNYYYLIEILTKQLEPHKAETPGLQKRMTRSLIEFVRYSPHRNVISKHLKLHWLKSNKLIFTGLLKEYDVELEKLSKLLGWKNAQKYVHNRTANKYDVTDEEMEIIKKFNKQDQKLYDFVLINNS